MIIDINQELLAKAVERTIRPHLIEEGNLSNLKQEGWQHSKTIPKVQALLSRQSLESNAKENVIKAVNANNGLLAAQEVMKAKAFAEEYREDDLADRFIDLLYDDRDLFERISNFLEWSAEQKRDADSERKKGFNGTVTAYLLSMTNPKAYAFVKPKVYAAATSALLGDAAIERDPARRIVHGTQFYTEALRLFREVHDLPFTDLMHTHIAFYITHRLKKKPNWRLLQEDKYPDPIPDPENGNGTRKLIMKAPLNQILYGPPGTGKTYHTIDKALQICDGQVPETREAQVKRFRELQDDGQIEFVTFHQSYGYEDFVEGIRPVLSEDAPAGSVGDGGQDGLASQSSGSVNYECRDGVFKKICALAASRPTRKVDSDIDWGSAKVYKMSLGDTHNPEDEQIYPDCIENNYVRLGWSEINVTGCDSKQDVRERFEEAGIEPNKYAVYALDSFKNRVAKGDVIIVSDGNRKFRAIAKVTGEYVFDNRDDSYSQMRPVEWLQAYDESLPCELILRKSFSQQTHYRLMPDTLKESALKDFLRIDVDESPKNYVLVIDEINRGNISKILGELITLLEPDKRIGAENELRVELPNSKKPFGVPGNLYLIGTMNTADRSIAFMDTALRRRFDFTEMMPDIEVVRSHVGKKGRLNDIDVAELLRVINERIELLFDRDHQIGHSYLLGVDSLVALRQRFVDKVIPLLQEYFYDDWNKLCIVLGCPYDADDGRADATYQAPLVVVRPLDAATLPGADDADYENALCYMLNPEFLNAEEDALAAFFNGIMNAESLAVALEG